MKRLFLLSILLAFLAVPSSAQYALQFGAAVAVSDDQVLVGEGRNLLMPGSVFVFEKADDTWQLADELNASDAGKDALGFGKALASHGSTLAVGAPTANAVYIFEKNDDGTWSEKQKISGDGVGFGDRAALHGDHLLIGVRGDRENVGQVHAYHRNDEGMWQMTTTLSTEDALVSRDSYGSVIALHENRAMVAAPGKDSRKGTVYTFAHGEHGWQSTGMLEAKGIEENNSFGSSLYMDAMHAVVGATGYDGRSGAVAIYESDADGAWQYDRRLTPFDARGNESFGTAVTYAGGRLWVGAFGYGDQEGAAYLFEPDMQSMRMGGLELLTPENRQYRSMMGGAIAANNEIAVVGAVGHDNWEGAAFVYSNGENGWALDGTIVNDAGEFASVTGDMVRCEDGKAGAFSCDNVDMVSFMTRQEAGAKRGMQVNDVWGWEDPDTGKEYAIIGRTDGTSFIDLSNPSMPVYLGNLPLTEGAHQSIWRDVKVYQDHAFIVSDGAGPHHMQVFDLRQLRTVTTPQEFEVSALYKGIYSSHNIVINEDTGFAYAVGSDSGGETCGGALHMINIQNPLEPTFAGCFADPRTGGGTGTTHDAQCVIYQGPDDEYQGREICLSSNGTALSIADVTDKDNPVAISIAEYPKVAYTHQGWLTDDHRYFYLNDEGDEVSDLVEATRTMIFDLSELGDPVMVGEYLGPDNAIDHNLYIKGDLMYQTNYVSGLRIIDISDRENPTEIGHFDTVPYGANDNSPVLGAWSNYPYFKSGVIVVTSGREGVFFLKKKDVDI